MKTILSVVVATFALAALAPVDALAGPQQERMKRCSQEAREKTLKGEERKQFMSGCLKGKHETAPASAAAAGGKGAAPVAQVEVAKKKACNRTATEQELKGAKRKAFIEECLRA
jgi:hypothetical protein